MYKRQGERRSVTDNLSQKTSSTYNGRGQVLATTYHDNTSTSRTYHDSGLQHQSFDELGRIATMQYDSYGRQTTSQAPGKAASQTFHRAMAVGGIDYSLDATGRRMDYEYDDDGKRIQSIMAEGTSDEAITTYAYDGDDLLLSATDAVGMVSSIEYDLLGRRVSSTVPGANASDLLVTTISYDTVNDMITTTYPDDTTSLVESDDLGRTTASVNENGERLEYSYFEETSWMSELNDARNNKTTWTYNDLGQVLSKIYPGTPVEVDSYTYDDLQRVATHTRPSQKRASYSYDLRNRVTDITWDGLSGAVLYGSGENQQISYFDDGRVKNQDNGEALVTLSLIHI